MTTRELLMEFDAIFLQAVDLQHIAEPSLTPEQSALMRTMMRALIDLRASIRHDPAYRPKRPESQSLILEITKEQQ